MNAENNKMNLAEILTQMEFTLEEKDGKYQVFDNQRGEYLDNGEDDEGKLKFDFEDAEEVIDRMEIYLNNYYLNELSENLSDINGFEAGSWEDIYNFANENKEKFNFEDFKGDLEVLNYLIHPETLEDFLPKDKRIEKLWEELEDVPFDENKDLELILSEDWNNFKKGTTKTEIWEWFDKEHSKGINYLVNEYDPSNSENIEKTTSQKIEDVKKALNENRSKNSDDENLILANHLALLKREQDKENNILGSLRPTGEQILDMLEDGWGIDEAVTGYIQGTSDDLPKDTIVIMKIDAGDVFYSDLDAAKQAEKDGVKLISENEIINKYPYNSYRFIDTEKNREILKENGYLKNFESLENISTFENDREKMTDFFILDKKNFLESYSYLTEEEYDATSKLVDKKYLIEEKVLNLSLESIFNSKLTEEDIKNGTDTVVLSNGHRIERDGDKRNFDLYSEDDILLLKNNDVLTKFAEIGDISYFKVGVDVLSLDSKEVEIGLEKSKNIENLTEQLVVSFDSLDYQPELWEFLIKSGADPKHALYPASCDAYLGDNLRWLIENISEEKWNEIKEDRNFCKEIFENARDSIMNDHEFSVNPMLELAEKIEMLPEAIAYCKELEKEYGAEYEQAKNLKESYGKYEKIFYQKELLNQLSEFVSETTKNAGDMEFFALRESEIFNEEREMNDDFYSQPLAGDKLKEIINTIKDGKTDSIAANRFNIEILKRFEEYLKTEGKEIDNFLTDRPIPREEFNDKTKSDEENEFDFVAQPLNLDILRDILSDTRESLEQKFEKTKYDFDSLADKLIQTGLENSTETNYQITFKEIAKIANKDEEWVKENIKNIRNSLSSHNDNELLDYPYDTKNEDNEKIIDLNYCSLDDDEMSLFRKENGRWVRKTETEVNLYYEIKDLISEDFYNHSLSEITDVKIYNPENYGFEKDDKIHVLVEFEGSAREDDIFNLLHDEENPLTTIFGKEVDCNPINIEKSGTVEQYLENLKNTLVLNINFENTFSKLKFYENDPQAFDRDFIVETEYIDKETWKALKLPELTDFEKRAYITVLNNFNNETNHYEKSYEFTTFDGDNVIRENQKIDSIDEQLKTFIDKKVNEVVKERLKDDYIADIILNEKVVQKLDLNDENLMHKAFDYLEHYFDSSYETENKKIEYHDYNQIKTEEELKVLLKYAQSDNAKFGYAEWEDGHDQLYLLENNDYRGWNVARCVEVWELAEKNAEKMFEGNTQDYAIMAKLFPSNEKIQNLYKSQEIWGNLKSLNDTIQTKLIENLWKKGDLELRETWTNELKNRGEETYQLPELDIEWAKEKFKNWEVTKSDLEEVLGFDGDFKEHLFEKTNEKNNELTFINSPLDEFITVRKLAQNQFEYEHEVQGILSDTDTVELKNNFTIAEAAEKIALEELGINLKADKDWKIMQNLTQNNELHSLDCSNEADVLKFQNWFNRMVPDNLKVDSYEKAKVLLSYATDFNDGDYKYAINENNEIYFNTNADSDGWEKTTLTNLVKTALNNSYSLREDGYASPEEIDFIQEFDEKWTTRNQNKSLGNSIDTTKDFYEFFKDVGSLDYLKSVIEDARDECEENGIDNDDDTVLPVAIQNVIDSEILIKDEELIQDITNDILNGKYKNFEDVKANYKENYKEFYDELQDTNELEELYSPLSKEALMKFINIEEIDSFIEKMAEHCLEIFENQNIPLVTDELGNVYQREMSKDLATGTDEDLTMLTPSGLIDFYRSELEREREDLESFIEPDDYRMVKDFNNKISYLDSLEENLIKIEERQNKTDSLQFDWSDFTEQDFNNLKEDLQNPEEMLDNAYGSVKIGDISIDIINNYNSDIENGYLDDDFYIFGEEGYDVNSVTGIPYDEVDGDGISFATVLGSDYETFQKIMEKEWSETISENQYLLEEAQRPTLRDWSSEEAEKLYEQKQKEKGIVIEKESTLNLSSSDVGDISLFTGDEILINEGGKENIANFNVRLTDEMFEKLGLFTSEELKNMPEDDFSDIDTTIDYNPQTKDATLMIHFNSEKHLYKITGEGKDIIINNLETYCLKAEGKNVQDLINYIDEPVSNFDIAKNVLRTNVLIFVNMMCSLEKNGISTKDAFIAIKTVRGNDKNFINSIQTLFDKNGIRNPEKNPNDEQKLKTLITKMIAKEKTINKKPLVVKTSEKLRMASINKKLHNYEDRSL